MFSRLLFIEGSSQNSEFTNEQFDQDCADYCSYFDSVRAVLVPRDFRWGCHPFPKFLLDSGAHVGDAI